MHRFCNEISVFNTQQEGFQKNNDLNVTRTVSQKTECLFSNVDSIGFPEKCVRNIRVIYLCKIFELLKNSHIIILPKIIIQHKIDAPLHVIDIFQ